MRMLWIFVSLLVSPVGAFAGEDFGNAPPPGISDFHSTGTVSGGAAGLQRRVRESGNKTRTIRRRLNAAKKAGDGERVERLRARLEESRAEHKRLREELLGAIQRGEASPEYRRLKKEIQEDLKAVRRVRYALNKALARSDDQEAAQLRQDLLKTKKRLKVRRRSLRRMMKGGGKVRMIKGGGKGTTGKRVEGGESD